MVIAKPVIILGLVDVIIAISEINSIINAKFLLFILNSEKCNRLNI
jgi:hypothetical protein